MPALSGMLTIHSEWPATSDVKRVSTNLMQMARIPVGYHGTQVGYYAGRRP
jgi:hypothetical protein